MTFNHPTVIVLLGATGDLATKKLLPALYDLFVRGELPTHFQLIGAAFDEYTDDTFREHVTTVVGVDQPQVAEFAARVRYVTGDFMDRKFYERVTATVHEFNTFIGQCSNVLYYLAVPPSLYGRMFDQLAENKSLDICAGTPAWARLLVEKPFGSDIKTAYALEEQLQAQFADEQVYRIDHYLAKHAIENIMTLRFANPLIEQSWQADCIESVEVFLYEDFDIGERGNFYDAVGALRDVGQNHLLQVLALLLMEPVDVHDAAAVRAARARVVEHLRFDSTQRPPVRGQYAAYRATPGVAAASPTETYFSFGLRSVAPEWVGVAISVAAGKALARQQQEAVITFRTSEAAARGITYEGDAHTNVLKIQFSPESGIRLQLVSREPGHTFGVVAHEYDLVPREATIDSGPDAYERVLLDCIRGDQVRFVSGTEVMAAWRLIETAQAELAARPLVSYQSGSEPTTIGDDY